jgi:hypothetical protein
MTEGELKTPFHCYKTVRIKKYMVTFYNRKNTTRALVPSVNRNHDKYLTKSIIDSKLRIIKD